jgi:NAD(P)-dependent dehydrogenase (short-subunit alcohol dehydrogenase family)
MSQQSLTGKIALVTGASRGIGRATALRLAADGAKVIVHYSASETAAREVVTTIEKAGGKAFAVAADLAQTDGAAKLLAAVEAGLKQHAWGAEIDILVNNAGVAEYVALADTTVEQFDKLFNVNVRGLFFTVQKFAPKIKEGGRIINVSSVVARTYFAGIPAYSATKGAVDTLTKHLAVELGARAITVNSISPGAIETDMSAWLRSTEGEAVARQIQAIPRVGKPEDVADAIAAVVSPDARWVTGQVIEVGGGTKL